MKFRCPNNTPVRVASTHGHVAIIGTEWREIPEVLRAEALALGCVCDQQVVQAVDPTRDPYGDPGPGAVVTGGERALIKSALKAMLMDRMEKPHEGDGEDPRFTADNLPRTEYVSEIAGITAAKEDVLAVWDELRSEALSMATVKTSAEKAREAAKAAPVPAPAPVALAKVAEKAKAK